MVVNAIDSELEVVLATWNGEAFLGEQLQSLWEQSLRPARVLVHDDGSSDGTLAILQHWIALHPGWILLLPAVPCRLGPTAAFDRLLRASRAPYVALCDQDDVWFVSRLATGLCQLKAVQLRLGEGTPLLFHSNAKLIDGSGSLLPRTLWQWHRSSMQMPALLGLAHHNQVTGCTMIANRALLQQALPIPGAAVYHDNWLALVARHSGMLLACQDFLLAHRRHLGNSSSNQHRGGVMQLALKLKRWNCKYRQWCEFCHRYELPVVKRLAWWPYGIVYGLNLFMRQLIDRRALF